MKVAILADIHGNIIALNAVLEEIDWRHYYGRGTNYK